jgi:hypothetical protein
MEYTIVSVIGGELFIEEVNQCIEQGWKPIGGVSVTKQGAGDLLVYHQAMIKEK